MKKTYKTGQHIYRILPCPFYDISGIENWLADMAADGLYLVKDGVFAGIATFEYNQPQKVKYRLEAAQKNTSMWSADGGEPDPEQVELCKKYSWEYVAKLKNFYVYRNVDPSARELNTDPEVQALALNAVKKRQRDAVITSVFLLGFYPFMLTRGCPLLTSIAAGTWWTLLVLLFAVLMITDEVRAFVRLKRVQKSLFDEGCYSPESDWRKNTGPYLCRKIIKAVLAIMLACAFLKNWGISITNENKIPIEEYTGVIPFATIQDLAGEGSLGYTLNMSGLGMSFNTIKEITDWLAPRVIDYNEHATIRTADGNLIGGGLYVEYYELRNTGLAKQLTWELYRFDKMKKNFDLMDAPELSADYVAAYLDTLHFPTVLIRKGNIVVKVNFYQTSQFYTIPIDEWAEIICDSIGKSN